MSQPRRQRLRYDDLDYEVFPNGRSRVEVRLEWRGELFSGSAEGMDPLQGSHRTAAQATLRAAALAAGGRIDLDLMGVKSFRAFDTLLIVAAVKATSGERSYRLIGVKAEEESESVETSARAVLDALNRVLELYVEHDDDDVRPGDAFPGMTPG